MRLPLAADLISRDGTTGKDSRIRNGLIDDGEVVVRPGVSEAVAPSLGLFSQGGLRFGDKLVYVNDDNFFWLSADFIFLGGFNSLNGNPIGFYSSGGSYVVGDVVVDDDGTPWYPVQPVSGIPPAYTTAAYPYWSRYKNLPSGTHPTVTYSWDVNSSVVCTPTTGDRTCSGTSLVKVYVGGVLRSEISGSVAVSIDEDPPYTYESNTYVDYNMMNGQLRNGYSDNFGGTPTITTTPITNHPTYLAAQDYARSVLV